MNPAPHPDLSPDPIIRLDDVSHLYPSGRRGVSHITLRIVEGERVALVGPSGSGKSTLLRTINGLVRPSTGVVHTLGSNVGELSEAGLRALRRRIGMIFQEFALIERLPVLTNVLVGRLGFTPTLPSLVRAFSSADVCRAREALRAVGLMEYEQALVRSLSGGQKQRVGIARALVQEPEVILGDEPTANLDVRTSEEVLALLVRLADERGATLLLSLHDVRAARRHCTRIVALREGEIAWQGPAAGFSEPEVEKVFY